MTLASLVFAAKGADIIIVHDYATFANDSLCYIDGLRH